MLIQIIGMGCPSCRRLEADVRAIVDSWSVEVDIERIEDPQQIVEMGIFSLPQLAADGEIISRGYRDRRRVEDALRQALGSQTGCNNKDHQCEVTFITER